MLKEFEIRQKRSYTTYIVVKEKTLQDADEKLHRGDYDEELGYQEIEQMNTDDYEIDIHESTIDEDRIEKDKLLNILRTYQNYINDFVNISDDDLTKIQELITKK